LRTTTLVYVNIWGCSKILNFKFQNLSTQNNILGLLTVLNKKLLNYKVLNLVETYNFDTKYVFIRIHMKKLWIIFRDIS
jgi:hypothetical protein